MRDSRRMRPPLILMVVALALVGVASVGACAPAEMPGAFTLPPAPFDAEAPADLATATFADG